MLLGLLASCRSAPLPPIRTEPPPLPSALEALPPGSALAIRRPTPGVALLSLWLEGGARAATPPQLATAAAFWAAEQAGASARVLPDGSELSLLCDTQHEGVPACARRLLRALNAPAPSEAELVRLRDRVRAARLAAANDVARSTDAAALGALLGPSARGLDPLGVADDDAAVRASAVQSFLARQHVAAHGLLVGVGDLEQSELAAAFAGSSAAPPAPGPVLAGVPGAPAAAAGGGLELALGAANQIALAVPVASVARAASLCESFLQVHTSASARISSLRGMIIAHLSLPGGHAPFARLQAAVFDLRRGQLEPPDPAPLPPPDGLADLSRQVGETWIARGAARTALASDALGVALTLARDEHAPTPGEEDALAKLRERAAQAVAQGNANSAGEIRGELSELSARVSTGNGARIEAVRRPNDAWFAAALRFAGGSAEDPPTAHGRAALLASLLADGCGFSAGRALDVWLATLKARLTPLLDADGVGVLISAPARNAEAALDTLLRCAVRPNVTARAVEDARARLLRSLWKREDVALQAALGQLLSPSAPGAVAPWGTPEGVARVDAGELRRLHEAHLRAPLVSVWVAADRDPAQSARFVARRLAQLSAQAPAAAAPALGARSELTGVLTEDTRLRVVIGVRSPASEHAGDVPDVFAHALGEALRKRVGEPLWTWGSGSSRLAVAGVALALREDELDALPAQAHAALRELSARPEAEFEAALRSGALSRRATLSSARGWAEAAFHGLAQAGEDASENRSLLRKLANEPPSFFVLRPRP